MLETLEKLGWVFEAQSDGRVKAIRPFGNSEFHVFFDSLEDLEYNWFDKFTSSYDELHVYQDEIRNIIDLLYMEDKK